MRAQDIYTRCAVWIAATSLAAVVALGVGCSSADSPRTSGPPGADPAGAALRVGTSPTLPPLIFKQAGKYSGLEADLARGFADELKRPLRIVELPWEELIESLINGKIDIIMSGLSITQPRQVRIDFSLPYLRSGQLALVRRKDVGRMQLFLLSPDTRFGYQRGTTGEYFVLQNLLRNRHIECKTPEDGAQALLKNKIDAFVHDAPVCWWLASEYEQRGLAVLRNLLSNEFLAWGVRKGDTELLKAANDYLQKIQTNGAMQTIVRRWLPQSTGE